MNVSAHYCIICWKGTCWPLPLKIATYYVNSFWDASSTNKEEVSYLNGLLNLNSWLVYLCHFKSYDWWQNKRLLEKGPEFLHWKKKHNFFRMPLNCLFVLCTYYPVILLPKHLTLESQKSLQKLNLKDILNCQVLHM